MSASAFQPDAASSATPLLRVVLVGKTGLDAVLRLDSTVELTRCADMREAIAELTVAGADAQSGHIAQACTVVLADDIWSSTEPSRRARFLEVARSSFAGLRILRQSLGPQVAKSAEGDASTDDIVMSGAPADVIRAAMRHARAPADAYRSSTLNGTAPAPAPAPSPTPTPSPSPAPAPNIAQASTIAPGRLARERVDSIRLPALSGDNPQQPIGATNADALLVERLLFGMEIEAEAIALIRDRLRDATVEFVPATHATNLAAAPFSGAQCPVLWQTGVPEGTANPVISAVSAVSAVSSSAARADSSAPAPSPSPAYGLLRAERTSLHQLVPHANWLATWLRLRDQQAQLREAAFTDPLTGAWNRRYFDRFMAGALDHARTHRHFLTVFVFDLDNFKKYNDQFGHEAGDQILKQTVSLLRSVVRPTDRVCRLGGDEFVVIFDEPEGSRIEGSRHPTSVAQLAKRFQRQLAAHRFPQLTQLLSQLPPASLTISGGLATFPWDGNSPEALLQSADRLLIQSKRQGKNVIELGSAMTQPEHPANETRP